MNLTLYSDQGSQYTSRAFTEFCESVNVTQSMSKAGYPYDNAPMDFVRGIAVSVVQSALDESC